MERHSLKLKATDQAAEYDELGSDNMLDFVVLPNLASCCRFSYSENELTVQRHTINKVQYDQITACCLSSG